MKRIIFFTAVLFCVFMNTTPVSAQFIVHHNGNAELGDESFDPDNTWLLVK